MYLSKTYIDKSSSNKGKRVILFFLFATVLIRFSGSYSMSPAFIKAIYSIMVYLSLLIFPYKYILVNDFGKRTNILIRVCILYGIYSILVSVFNTAPDMYAFGNKWLTLFGNDQCALLFVPPIFIYLSQNTRLLRFAIKTSGKYIAITSIYLIFGNIYSLAYVSIWIWAFYHYVSKKYKLAIYFTILITVVAIIITARMLAIPLCVGIFANIFAYSGHLRLLKYSSFGLLLLVPLVFLPILTLTDYVGGNEESPFVKIQEVTSSKTKDENLTSDTRTFLYVEMAADLTNTNSWILGKGAYAHYYSAFFDESLLGKYGRINSEVPFLSFLLHGGIVYVCLYFGIFLIAIWKALYRGKNRFVKCVAMILSGIVFNSFIGDMTGCNFLHLMIFMLVGCCLSKRWLNYTDDEIKAILKFG